jgi:hypothetical protein
VLLAVGVAQAATCSLSTLGNIARRIDGVEIADQRNGDPVIAVDLVVAADDDAILAVVAGAKHGGRIGADVIEIDGGVAGGVHRAKIAVGLFHEQRDRGVGERTWAEKDGRSPRTLLRYRPPDRGWGLSLRVEYGVRWITSA